jgi:hypothetical protein
VLDFDRSAIAIERDPDLGALIAQAFDGADMHLRVRSISEPKGDKCGIVGGNGRSAVGLRLRVENLQVREDLADIVDEPLSRVDHVRSEVAENAVGARAVVAPLIGAAGKRDGELETRVVTGANEALFEQPLQIAPVRLPPPGEEHHVFDTDRDSLVAHRSRFSSGVGEWLFAVDVQTRVEHVHGHSVVEVIRYRNDDRLDTGSGDEIAVVGEDLRDTEFGGDLLRRGLVATAYRDNHGPRVALEAW